ncbi:hypothetical protein CLOSTMETH_03803 [[Clostridium] methylpentosum DSM 5476]|uniref:Uncharacterized protein n=1 Tax=[Clostridium] methylpentosum DSM 5476 TaxID=537013 RepID=C0EIV8_9FIRM|nr:hypothetical protein CLOSTMETH_03803 [[Clostridium] methylpentosum DSM 5476]
MLYSRRLWGFCAVALSSEQCALNIQAKWWLFSATKSVEHLHFYWSRMKKGPDTVTTELLHLVFGLHKGGRRLCKQIQTVWRKEWPIQWIAAG